MNNVKTVGHTGLRLESLFSGPLYSLRDMWRLGVFSLLIFVSNSPGTRENTQSVSDRAQDRGLFRSNNRSSCAWMSLYCHYAIPGLSYPGILPHRFTILLSRHLVYLLFFLIYLPTPQPLSA